MTESISPPSPPAQPGPSNAASPSAGAPLVPPRKRNRLRYGIVVVVCLAAVGWMLVLLQKNVVFFKTVSEAVHDQSHDGTRTMRIGGGVLPTSIHQRGDGADFDLTEGGVTVHIHHVGNEPELFKDCAPVVAEGHWSAVGSTTFDSTRLLIKHGADYTPPKTATQCPADPFGN
ncbi:MAG: cytochrome c-type biosis protein CcmE [Actinomycetota bacterium]|nr:cytochrome c-type biosis protein CcmE [Actinomycetota bacterium]